LDKDLSFNLKLPEAEEGDDLSASSAISAEEENYQNPFERHLPRDDQENDFFRRTRKSPLRDNLEEDAFGQDQDY